MRRLMEAQLQCEANLQLRPGLSPRVAKRDGNNSVQLGFLDEPGPTSGDTVFSGLSPVEMRSVGRDIRGLRDMLVPRPRPQAVVAPTQAQACSASENSSVRCSLADCARNHSRSGCNSALPPRSRGGVAAAKHQVMRMASAGAREGVSRGAGGGGATASLTPASGLKPTPRQCVAGINSRRLPGSPPMESRALAGHGPGSPRPEKRGPVSPRAEEHVAPCPGAPLPAQVPTPEMVRNTRTSQVPTPDMARNGRASQQEREQRPSGVQRQVSTPIPQRSVWPTEPLGRASEGHASAYTPSQGSTAAPAQQVPRRTTGPRVLVVPPSAKFEPPTPTTDHFTPNGKAKPDPLEQALSGKDSGLVPPRRSAVEVAEELVAGAAATARAAAEVAATDGWRSQQQHQQPPQQPPVTCCTAAESAGQDEGAQKQAAQLVTLADLHMAAKRAGELHSQGIRDRRNLGGA